MDVCSLLLLLLLQLQLQLHNAAAASASAEGCPAGAVEVATLDGQPACEDFSQLNGSLTLPPAAVAAGAATDAAGDHGRQLPAAAVPRERDSALQRLRSRSAGEPTQGPASASQVPPHVWHV